MTDPPPGSGFDLIHTRLVLIHLAERGEVVRRLVEALRPGDGSSWRTSTRTSHPTMPVLVASRGRRP